MNQFLGLDLSTQSLTAVVIDPSDGEVHRYSIDFDERYPAYKTQKGVLVEGESKVVHADPRMWVEAVDDILNVLREKRLSPRIGCIGVSAQQHGTVYLNRKAEYVLSRLDSSQPLLQQINNIFSRPTSPVWMDSSTHQECLEITAALGGEANVVRLTGSRATERFSGPQIRKFWKEDPSSYRKTEHIGLISSFITSLLIGRVAPVDSGDGFGTNLADIRKGKWSKEALIATSPDLESRLPKLLGKDESLGTVAQYLVERYGFTPTTEVIVGSGDNPNSLVGLGLIGETERRAISLGTSDTYFGYMRKLSDGERSEGHIFGTADGNYMFLLCFKNGSLAREHIKNMYNLSWNDFSEILLTTSPGNDGRIMLPFFSPEITPLVLNPKVWRFGGLAEEDVKGNVRGIAEAQIMSMYLHSAWAGKRPKTILVTGGGSDNPGLLKLISQVFNAVVQTFEVKDSAALGAAIRAAHWSLNKKGIAKSWNELWDLFTKEKAAETVSPYEEEVQIYHAKDGLLSVYDSCEKFALGFGENPDGKLRRFRRIFVRNT